MTLAPEEILRAAETLARDVEGLDTEVRIAGDQATEAQRARRWAKHQRLLLELDAAGILDGTPGTTVALAGFTHVGAYHQAATALRAYLASPERAAVFPTVPKVVDSRISLDWFRLGRGPVSHALIAAFEQDIAASARTYGDDQPSDDGVLFTQRAGHTWMLRSRREVGTLPVLYAAELETTGVAAAAPASFDPAFVATGNVIACDHKPQAQTWFVAVTATEAGATLVGSKNVAPGDRDGWLAELARRDLVAGWTYGGSRIVWAADAEHFTIWLPDQRIVRTRAELADVIGTSSIASDDHVDRTVRLHRRGGKVELLAAEHDSEARLDPTYGRAELLESDGRWCAYCARDLARWLHVHFVDETFGLEGV